jgi:hypothetical protein
MSETALASGAFVELRDLAETRAQNRHENQLGDSVAGLNGLRELSTVP